MAHWRALPGINWLELDYERLVSDPAGSARELARYVGLSWDEGMLDPSRRRLWVNTASAGQVTRAIDAASVGRWTRYRELLPACILALADSPDTDTPG